MKSDTVFQIGVAPRRIDLLTSISGVEFDLAWDQRKITLLDDKIEVAVLGREQLLVNKLASGRPKDLVDAALVERARMKAPRYSLRSLLLLGTIFCVYFTIGRLAPLLAFAIFCLLSVLAIQAAAMGLVHMDSASRSRARYLLPFVASVLIVVLVIWIGMLKA